MVWNQDFAEPDPPGDNYAVAFFTGGCVLELPADQCADNLKVNPCQATLQQLDACLLVEFSLDPPSTLPDVCKTYRATSSCDETVIGDMTMVAGAAPNSAPWTTCSLPVRVPGGPD
jgi:hypothetical protein